MSPHLLDVARVKQIKFYIKEDINYAVFLPKYVDNLGIFNNIIMYFKIFKNYINISQMLKC